MAVDGQHIYWTNTGSGTIGRANLDGTGVNQNFITATDVPYGVTVDAGHVYWTNVEGGAGLGSIGRANLNGSGANGSFQTTGVNGPIGITVTGTHMDQRRDRGDRGGRPQRRGGQRPLHLRHQPNGLTRDAQRLYWANPASNTIGAANLDGSGVNESFISGASRPLAVAVGPVKLAITTTGPLRGGTVGGAYGLSERVPT